MGILRERENQIEVLLPFMNELANPANRLHLLLGSGKILEQHIGPEILLWLLLEITVGYN